jgi:hypothetical protein
VAVMTEGAVAVRMLICHTYDGTPFAQSTPILSWWEWE